MAKNIIFDEKARQEIKKGADKLANAVRMTLGPRGRAAVIEKSYGAPQVTFDGVTVAREIELKDKNENLGADLIKQAADKTNDAVGDGTSTAVVLAQSMIDEGEKLIQDKGFNVIQLAEKLKQESVRVIEALEAQKEPVDDNKKIEEVATLSSKDKEIGRLIAEVMESVGKDGVVTVDDSNTVGNSYEIVEGMQFDRGYISPYMITDQDRMEAMLENPYILVTDQKVSAISELLPLLEKIMQSGKKELVLIADDIEGEALATLIVNKLRGVFNVLAVKAPGFGDRKKEMLQDIAVVTGASFISGDLGKKLDSTEIADLGSAEKVVSDKDDTTIVGGKGDKGEISNRINQLKSQLEMTDSDFDREKIEERLGKLAGGVAVIRVGAPTESAQKELKDRVNDAVHATKAAMEEGVVPGGGMALYNVDLFGEGTTSADKVSEAVRIILKRALHAPVKAIILNSGGDEKTFKEFERRKADSKDRWLGFDGLTNKVVNLKDVGINDPLKVTKTAFLNAVSVASTYLTLGAAITEIPEDKKDLSASGMPGM
ncbi:MAG: chaperonin GroEL [Candidatus Colwellbacteria bacterium CG10_big_fil_rev_8_21_14_0_10_42_22]|uniref:60 kDa chaperonin n=1 Tax=Candidatus Colwellbacteria bacterium CG10_big_fil_rev_8_21_14_0_10_42_22 TaxID=1974540 RepID=A0A2H0VGF0_9BACT|nr:MAG: chaperonin GroEL [Candidatus Colwellbacteria bacterium CG10_big_fil_rev_8_21_14_0_10_42_22]